ncbi:MAG: helix-turn-helix domain-containing protein [Rhodocyclaceae bacterium]|nr:helix-turn-helix domain-containing protein [Rhodocyclaceae bacterium]
MYDFTVLVLRGAFASSVAATLDMLATAARLAPRLGVAAPRWRVCSVDGGPMPLANGCAVATTRLPARPREDRSAWVVPGLGLDGAAAVRGRMADADFVASARALARHARAGGRVAASCSAVFLLASAGLLSGRRATTSWWYAPLLARLAEGCTVDADRMVCADGPVVTGGAAMAQADLMLHLLREHSGGPLADAVARVLLIDARQAQAPFIVPEVLANGDDLVLRITARVEAGLPAMPSVGRLAGDFCMSARTLARRVRRATGRSPVALLQSIRLRRARALLEASRMTVEQVAEAVGYRDATALRRLMRKVAGASPSRYRPSPAG